MNVEPLKKQWNKYLDEFENTEEMDIEKHIQMALKIGGLIQEIERLEEYIDHLKHENNLLYGRLNQIRDLTNKEIK